MHLHLSKRIEIETMLNNNKTFKEIGIHLNMHPDSIRNEVSLHKILKQHKVMGKISKPLCKNKNNCNLSHPNCFNKCNNYIETKCEKLKYNCSVCNGCENKGPKCRLNKFYYSADEAHKDYKNLLINSRVGINLTEEESKNLNEIITPLIKKGFSPEQIIMIKPELNISIKTLYNYIDKKVFDLDNLDLLRQVSYKKRKSNKSMNKKVQSFKEGKTYNDFINYINDNNIIDIVEMDTVEAIKDDNEPCLLTLLFRRTNLQIAILLKDQKSESVVEAINNIYNKIGHIAFEKYFKVILTDNGKEMKLPKEIEFNNDNIQRCKLFYCDAYTSSQKAKCEKNHDFIRRYIRKNTSMKKYSQDDINLMMSHINSIPRKLNCNKKKVYTPFLETMKISNIEFLTQLSIKKIEFDDLIINNKLFK